MRLHSFRVKNFRRLKDVYVDLDKEVSIFVGANNSGKTSATHALQMFLGGGSETRFSIHDFSSDCWRTFDRIGNDPQSPTATATLPKMTLDLWFEVGESDLPRVIGLLPRIDWVGTLVGVRVEFAPKNQVELLARFRDETAKTASHKGVQGGKAGYHPWPKTLTDYLSKRLSLEYGLFYLVLDYAQFDENFKQREGYEPASLSTPEGGSGAQVLKNLVRVDCLNAQRHLTDDAPTGRAEDLSKRLSRFYKRNLQKRDDDYDALKALADSEVQLNDHLSRVFEPTLGELRKLGYPGLRNPRLVIKSALNPENVMNQSARVHYAVGGLDGSDFTLPDKYNGLGFKNLIYMVVELLDLHAQWTEIKDDRPPLHFVFIEEPETHLHAQLQQVFAQRVFDILRVEEADAADFGSQLVITTHSAHILFEGGFKPIRYFRRSVGPLGTQESEVLNISKFYSVTQNPTRDFLERYMKLTHCDLFFSDGAILVEGNAERLLMPLMVEKAAASLRSAYLCTLEVGGAFGHQFRTLIEFLGIQTLVITDIDSVRGPTPAAGVVEDPSGEDSEHETQGGACMVVEPGAMTSNQTLIQWLPKKSTVAELLVSTAEEKTQTFADSPAAVRVVFQTSEAVTWNAESGHHVGRTFEEAFAVANLEWCQNLLRRKLGLRVVSKISTLTLSEILKRLFERVGNKNFDKTDFALAVLNEDPSTWRVPAYIAEGLQWLSKQLNEEVAQMAAGSNENVQ